MNTSQSEAENVKANQEWEAEPPAEPGHGTSNPVTIPFGLGRSLALPWIRSLLPPECRDGVSLADIDVLARDGEMSPSFHGRDSS